MKNYYYGRRCKTKESKTSAQCPRINSRLKCSHHRRPTRYSVFQKRFSISCQQRVSFRFSLKLNLLAN